MLVDRSHACSCQHREPTAVQLQPFYQQCVALQIRAVLPASGAGLELLPGDNTIPWRDGTSYPGNIPNSHYSRPAGDESSASQAMIGQIAAAGVGSLLCVMLMLVAAGYIRLNKTLNSIASSEVIDLQSPITKAVAILKVMARLGIIWSDTVSGFRILCHQQRPGDHEPLLVSHSSSHARRLPLQEISATRLTSLHQRKRAMEAALALLQAENVHAPDWKSQVNNQNKDILSFLTFDAKVGGNKPALDAGSHRTWSMFKRILRQDTSATGSSREPSLVPIHDSRISFSVPDRNLLRDAGKDVFFDVLAFAKLSSCKPLLSISIHVLRNFNLARILHLNEEVFAAFVAAIEEGCVPFPLLERVWLLHVALCSPR